MTQTNQVFIITFAIIVFGFLLKYFDFISEKDGKTLSKFLMHTTFPALMLITTATVKLDKSLVLIPIFAIVVGLVMLAVAWFWFANYPNESRGLFSMGVGGFNTGLFGFPIIESLFGRESLVFAIMFDIGNTMIVFLGIYTIGSYFSPNKKEQKGILSLLKKVLILPPVTAMIIGLFINFLAIPIPSICYDFLDILAKANKPVVLLLIGIYLSFELDKKAIIGIAKVLIIRYFIGFVMLLTIYFALPDYQMMRNVLMICLLLPIGMTILPFSDELRYDSRIAGTLLNISLLMSFVLMWILVLILAL